MSVTEKSLDGQPQNPANFDRLRDRPQEHSTTVKIFKIAGVILGLGLLAPLPFAASFLGARLTITLATAGGLLTLASLRALFASNPASVPGANSAAPPNQVSPPKPAAPLPHSVPLPSFEVPFEIQDGPLSGSLSAVNSSVLKRLPGKEIIETREGFMKCSEEYPAPWIGRSDFVSDSMLQHLMRNKKDRALGVKYVLGDAITNMEGVLHTFVTPVCVILMTGDYKWEGQLKGKSFGNQLVRERILSAAIHPDFENSAVMMQVVKLRDEAVAGESLGSGEAIPSAQEKSDGTFRSEYDAKIHRHLIYHLLPDQRLPALHEISLNQIMKRKETEAYLENLICSPQIGRGFQWKFMEIGESIISLELLYNTYIHQFRNEFTLLQQVSQGYVYTMNPPKIFAETIEGEKGAAILNRLQALAFQALAPENLFSNLRVLGFCDYADKKMIPLLERVFPNTQVVPQNDLFQDGQYKGSQDLLRGLALVSHNNSDAFGQNIETEKASSLDGVIGLYSNAAVCLKRDRPDLLAHVITTSFLSTAHPALESGRRDASGVHDDGMMDAVL